MSEKVAMDLMDRLSKMERKLDEKESRIAQLEMKLNTIMDLMKKVNMVEDDTYEVSSLKTRLFDMECRIENLE